MPTNSGGPDESCVPDSEVTRLTADFDREAARVGVDWDASAERMREIAEKHEVVSEDGETMEVTFTMDFTGLVETLKRLPDGAGTAAFLDAFEADQRRKPRGPTNSGSI